jgi:hypothetical protein
MRKIFLIEKIEDKKTKYLFKVHQAVYWTEDINQATQFDSEKNADDYFNQTVREQKISFFKITTFYINK